MFDDLNNQKLNKVPFTSAKAYPSVNSPNDGGFNSEENLRWIINTLTTKPFIIGKNDDIVNGAFGANGQAGNGIYTAPGMFSIDGYVIKLAQMQDISFDNTNTSTFMLTNTQSIQRFVHELTCQGTEDAIEQDITKLLFDEYNPATKSESELQESWSDAYENNKCIGYVCNRYVDTYLSQLSLTPTDNPETVSFEIAGSVNSVRIVSVTKPVTSTVAEWVADLLNYGIINNGESFATYTNTDNVINLTIYYPLYFKDVKMWNESEEKYNLIQQIQFNDIFGLTYFYDTQICESRSYPTTHNVFADMNNNYPLIGTEFTDCNLNTFPTRLYNFELLYDSNSNRISTTPQGWLNTWGADISSIFDEYTIENLLQYIPESQSNIPYIRNTLKYYCIKDISDSEHLIVNNLPVPVAFMTSEGSLCPNGFMYSDTSQTGSQTYSRYPVEGYLHFAKRRFLQNGGNSNPSEDDINAVTVQQMCADSWFSGFYNSYLAKPVSFYIHFSYCSLLDNVIYGKSGIGYTGIPNDYKDIKSAGCGNKLYEEKQPTVTQDENRFFTYLNYTYNGYINNGTQMQQQQGLSTKITYHNDLTSDVYKSNNFVYGTPNITSTSPTISYYKKPSDATVSDPENNVCIYIEDPINYFKHCSTSLNSITGFGVVKNITMYKITNSGMVAIEKKINGNNGLISGLVVDEFLMPVRFEYPQGLPQGTSILYRSQLCAIMETHTAVSLGSRSQVKSVINGLCLQWLQNCWKTEIPYTLIINKDNLNYLRSYDFTDPDYYKGISFNYRLPQDLNNDELFIYNLIISTSAIIGDFDIETSTRVHDTTSEYSKRRREAFIHFNKLYGDDFCSIDDQIRKIIDEEVPNLSDTVAQIQDDIATINQNIETVESSISDIELEQQTLSGTVTELSATATKYVPLTDTYTGRLAISSDDSITEVPANGTITYQIPMTDLGYTGLKTPHCLLSQVVDPGGLYVYNSNIILDSYYIEGTRIITIIIKNTSDVAQTDILIDYLLIY